MPAGLQIWDKASGGMVVDLTTQFTNIIGYVDIPLPEFVNGQYVWAWNSINVPQFSLGVPFYFSVLNWSINHPDWASSHPLYPQFSFVDDYDVVPEMYVSGTTFFYRYTPLSAIPFGDQTWWQWGGHRLYYGVN